MNTTIAMLLMALLLILSFFVFLALAIMDISELESKVKGLEYDLYSKEAAIYKEIKRLSEQDLLSIEEKQNPTTRLLKEQSKETCWKPSKEQINALEHFVRSIGESGYASPYDNNTKLLYSLLTDLQVLEKQSNQREQLINKACDVLADCIEDYMLRRMDVWSEECKSQTLENIRKKLEE